MHPRSAATPLVRLRRRLAAPALLALVAAGCADDATAPAAPAAARVAAAPAAAPAATMRFGRPGLNAFAHMSPKGMEHSGAGHAMDKVYPGTVSIRAGETVAFESFPVHQIAIYAPGTAPADIRLDPEFLDDVSTPFGDFPDVLIDDPANRLALSPISFETMTWTPDAATFARKGRYLVICTIVFHYVEARMYGWVVVR